MKTKKLKPTIALLIMLSVNYLNAQVGDYDPHNPPPSSGMSEPCIQPTTSWYLGGNNITAPIGWNPDTYCPTCPIPIYDAGTCNNFPFVLKANNFPSVFIQPSGNIGINIPNPAVALDIMSATSGNQSRFKIFGDQNGNVESTSSMRLHYNANDFEINQGTSASPIPRLSIDALGVAKIYNKLDVGAGMVANTGARLGVDAKSSTGVLIVGDNGNNGAGNMAFAIANGAGAGRFRVWINASSSIADDTKAHIAGNTQIGFYQSGGDLLDNGTRLNVDAANVNGIEATTNNATRKMFFVNYNTISTFEVHGDGSTNIGAGRPLSTGVAANAMLSVDGMILAKDIRVAVSTQTHWADYVFEKNYKLMPLNEIEKFVSKNKHLPGVPSEAEVKTEGVDLTEMNIQLLQKVEELYLHSINLQKQNDKLEKQIEKLSSDIKAVSK